MILPELLVSTSILSLAFFVWAVLAKYNKDGVLASAISESDSGESEVDPLPREEESLHGDSDQVLIESCSSSVCGDSFKDETPLSSSPGTPKIASGLSRRQRKNRKKEEKGNKKSISPILSRTSSEELKPETTSRSKKNSLQCKYYSELNLPDQNIYQMLCSYMLTLDQLRQLGYPMDSVLYPGKAYIYRDPELCSLLPDGNSTEFDDTDILEQGPVTSLDATAKPFFPEKSYTAMLNKYSNPDCPGPVLNATAKEFIPSVPTCQTSKLPTGSNGKKPLKGVLSAHNLKESVSPLSALSSSNASSSSSSSSSSSNVSLNSSSVKLKKQLRGSSSLPSSTSNLLTSQSSFSSTEAELNPVSSILTSRNTNQEPEPGLVERRCVRCSKTFYMYPEGDYFSQETCTYHWGKLRTDHHSNPSYQCCSKTSKYSCQGCSSASRHVWTGLPHTSGIHGPLDGYVKTKYRKNIRVPKEGNFGVFGVDCEMCYTSVGLELTKVTVVGIDGRLVYESLVNPEHEIIDYNTRFSGITAKHLNRGSPKTLKEVQNDLNGFINADSIVIGHGLENDLRALNLIHGCVIDTSIVFPHFYGLPYRRSLRSLVSSYLKREIQGNSLGHDSYEDAVASLELMLWKLVKDLRLHKANKMTDLAHKPSPHTTHLVHHPHTVVGVGAGLVTSSTNRNISI